MSRFFRIGWLGTFLVVIGMASWVWAETIEMTTFYPTQADAGDMNFDNVGTLGLTVGEDFRSTTPGDGELLIVGPMGVGTDTPATLFHINDDMENPDRSPLLIDRAWDGARIQFRYNRNYPGAQVTFGELGMVYNNFGMGRFWAGMNLDSTGTGHVTRPKKGTLAESAWYSLWETMGDFYEVGRIPPGTASPEIGGGGGTMLRITSAGSVGIGTSTPTNTLDVIGGAAFQGNHLYVRNSQSPAGTQTWGIVINTSDGVFNLGQATDVPPSGGQLTTSSLRIFPGAPNSSLVISDFGNVGILSNPTSTASPTNGLATGNLDVNDIFLRSKGQWLSQGGGGNQPDYDSGWVRVARASREYNFVHNLGYVPSRIALTFSPNASGTTVYYKEFNWGSYDGNPVSVKSTTTTITLGMYAGVPLHSYWSGRRWTRWWNTGWYRVVASR